MMAVGEPAVNLPGCIQESSSPVGPPFCVKSGRNPCVTLAAVRFGSFMLSIINCKQKNEPRAPMTSIFEGQPPKTRVIWVLGIYIYVIVHQPGTLL